VVGNTSCGCEVGIEDDDEGEVGRGGRESFLADAWKEGVIVIVTVTYKVVFKTMLASGTQMRSEGVGWVWGHLGRIFEKVSGYIWVSLYAGILGIALSGVN
jgi:hypothetical protein